VTTSPTTSPTANPTPTSTEQPEPAIREVVREKYAAAARAIQDTGAGCCGSSTSAFVELSTDKSGHTVFGADLYASGEIEGAEGAVAGSLGCGVPTAVADLHPGETVLDLGSGAGGDVLISARRVAPGGRAIGLDMTPDMLELARRNAAEAGVDNVEFLEGYLEEIPLEDATVDVIISNCVINLAADKDVVLAEAFRVLRPGGRLAVSDVVAHEDMDDATRADLAEWTGCIAGALTEADYRASLERAGFTDVDIDVTHAVHRVASSAIIRARRPE
jgi:SAM-dependent methyltransferase